MEIFKTKDVNAVKAILIMAEKFIEKEQIKEYSLESFIKWLRWGIENPLIGVWLSVDNEQPKGYAVAIIHNNLEKDFVLISHLWSEVEEIEAQLYSLIIDWAKKYGINEVRTFSKFPKKWKKLGFSIDTHVAIKEV